MTFDKVKVKITKPPPWGDLDDYDIQMNAFEMGTISAIIYDFIREHPDRKYLLSRILKQIDEFYVREKYGDEFFERYKERTYNDQGDIEWLSEFSKVMKTCLEMSEKKVK